MSEQNDETADGCEMLTATSDPVVLYQTLCGATDEIDQLKRERDEARRYANKIDLCQSGVAPCELAVKLMGKMDEALARHPDGTCLDCGGPLQAVRPGKEQCNACDNLRHIQTMLEETAKLAATLKQERDDARQQLATRAESIPQDNPTRHGRRVEKTEQDLQP